MEDRIVENFSFEEKAGKFTFSGKVTSEMLTLWAPCPNPSSP